MCGEWRSPVGESWTCGFLSFYCFYKNIKQQNSLIWCWNLYLLITLNLSLYVWGQVHTVHCKSMKYYELCAKQPGWSLLICYNSNSALAFHMLLSLGHALTPNSTQRARLVHSNLCIWWGEDMLVWISECNDRFSLQILNTLFSWSLLKTFTSWHASASLIAFAAGWLQQVHFPIRIDNICGVSLFAKRSNHWFYSIL